MTVRPGPLFVLDTNVFINAHRTYYRNAVCPGFWNCLVHHAGTERIVSLDKVRDEIKKGDWLHGWSRRSLPSGFFHRRAAPDIVAEYGRIAAWVQDRAQYSDAVKANFANIADGWVVALAKARGGCVVSHENGNRETKKTVPMPVLCDEFAVPACDVFDMLEQLEASFHFVPLASQAVAVGSGHQPLFL